ncbi:MAG: chromosome segregation SMC family protein [Thaumarchaeota archaeon]|nr:chromosome segregation SMC family protein [Nitrososphaerota archaeon]
MVHIKKVEIFGFKSFGFRNTVVNLDPGLVSISGPNGSGKSNILDAIIFATGETRPTMMRVPKMQQLLHDVDGGSSSGGRSPRRGARMARVALHFDNSDRIIPVASDSVVVTRELDEGGEQTYYLNNKKDSRAHITDILDVARAGSGPKQLNVVQQGTVTRISEYTPTEKRNIIEDLIGISSFDEKAANARDELDKADRTLEVSLARMNEVKKRIDELEVDRNLKMRCDIIQADLTRYRAADAAAKLELVEDQRASMLSELNEAKAGIAALSELRDGLLSEIGSIEEERSGVMEAEKAYRTEKADLESQIRTSLQAHDEAKSRRSIAENRQAQIRRRLGEIKVESDNISNSRSYTDMQVRDAEERLAGADSTRETIRKDLERTDSELRGILQRQSDAAARRSELDDKIRRLVAEKEGLVYEKMGLEHRRDSCLEKMEQYGRQLAERRELVGSLQGQSLRLKRIMSNSRDTVSKLESRMRALEERGKRAVSDREDLEFVLERSSSAATKYASKIKTVKGFMHEDYSTAKLLENAGQLGIRGLVYEMMSWDPEYERPIMAASTDWIKAVVVDDFATLFAISESARVQKLPKFRILPLEALSSLEASDARPPRAVGGVETLGTLAGHVRCRPEHEPLREFLFGGVVLVRDRDSAISVSRSGHRVVTMSGEYFEPRSGTVTVDTGSKISRITKLISMSSDVDGLFKLISVVKRHIRKKKQVEKKTAESVSVHAERLKVSQGRVDSAGQSLQYVESRLGPAREAAEGLPGRLDNLRAESDSADAEITSLLSRIESMQNEINLASAKHMSSEQMQIADLLTAANSKKAELEARRTEANTAYSRIHSELSECRSTAGNLASQDDVLRAEAESLGSETDSLDIVIEETSAAEGPLSDELTKLRQKEQEMIMSSGSSMDVIKQYDDKLNTLRKEERSHSVQISGLERKTDKLESDLSALVMKAGQLRQVAEAWTAEEPPAHAASARGISAAVYDSSVFDVEQVISELEAELESVAEFDAGAPSKYAEITQGYKMQSVRKNSLESERNSIVRFINKIEREKRQTFLDAFEVVDGEIRRVFKKMTGGGACLELQDEDDIFSSGISYMVQFPDKQPRESTSISGGEKTLAAVVFVLGLQKLQPAPFYLFDEVDAHLDASNAEKLSNILAERSRDSQFVVVSLKDSVVEKAGLVYGVFPKGGVSNVVTYKDRRFMSPVIKPKR